MKNLGKYGIIEMMKMKYLTLLFPLIFSSCFNVDSVIFTFINQSTHTVMVIPDPGEDWLGFTLNPAPGPGNQTTISTLDSTLQFNYTDGSGGVSGAQLTNPVDGNRTFLFSN